MKDLKNYLAIAAFIILALASCTKDNDINEEVIENGDPNITETKTNTLTRGVTGGEDGELQLACLTIVTPFDLVVDGTPYTINSEEDFSNAITNADSTSTVDFAYPFDVTTEDGNTITIADVDALGEAFAECVPDGEWGSGDFPAYDFGDNPCFDLNFPVGLYSADGETYTANDEEEFIGLLVDNNGALFFDFPISVNNADGDAVEVESEEALLELLIACDDSGVGQDTVWTTGSETVGDIACYDVVFPINLITDGGVVTVEGESDLIEALLTYNSVGFEYPITLVTDDSLQLTINSDEELGGAIAACGGFAVSAVITLFEYSTDAGGDCYSIVYPITVGTSVVNSTDELIDAFNTMDIELQYPVQVTIVESGDTQELNSDEDVNALVSNCE